MTDNSANGKMKNPQQQNFILSFFTCFIHVQLFLVCHVRAGFIIMLHAIWLNSIRFIFDAIYFSSKCIRSPLSTHNIDSSSNISDNLRSDFHFLINRWTTQIVVQCIQQQTKIVKNIFENQYPLKNGIYFSASQTFCHTNILYKHRILHCKEWNGVTQSIW